MTEVPPVGVELPAGVELVELDVRAARRVIEAAFGAAGTGPEEAARITDALLAAELAEVPTHGLLRLPWYLAALRSGAVRPAGEATTFHVTRATASIDGAGAYGYLPTWRAMEAAVELAGEHGVGAVGIRAIAEFGRAGYYAQEIATRGYVGIVCQNTIPLLAAPGSDRATHGNNPLAFAVPGADGPTFDAAFTHRSGGELRRRALLGMRLPPEWGYVDEHGDPTDDPAVAAASVQQAVGGAKGFGIAVLVDVLAGVLTGSASSVGVPSGVAATGAMVIVIEPAAFGANPARIVDALSRSAGAVRGSGGRWPGDRSRSAAARSAQRGTVVVPAPIFDEAVLATGDQLRSCAVVGG